VPTEPNKTSTDNLIVAKIENLELGEGTEAARKVGDAIDRQVELLEHRHVGDRLGQHRDHVVRQHQLDQVLIHNELSDRRAHTAMMKARGGNGTAQKRSRARMRPRKGHVRTAQGQQTHPHLVNVGRDILDLVVRGVEALEGAEGGDVVGDVRHLLVRNVELDQRRIALSVRLNLLAKVRSTHRMLFAPRRHNSRIREGAGNRKAQ